jgi:hypothetical protein
MSCPFSEWTCLVLFAVDGWCSLSARLPAGKTRGLNPPLLGAEIVQQRRCGHRGLTAVAEGREQCRGWGMIEGVGWEACGKFQHYPLLI